MHIYYIHACIYTHIYIYMHACISVNSWGWCEIVKGQLNTRNKLSLLQVRLGRVFLQECRQLYLSMFLESWKQLFYRFWEHFHCILLGSLQSYKATDLKGMSHPLIDVPNFDQTYFLCEKATVMFWRFLNCWVFF